MVYIVIKSQFSSAIFEFCYHQTDIFSLKIELNDRNNRFQISFSNIPNWRYLESFWWNILFCLSLQRVFYRWSFLKYPYSGMFVILGIWVLHVLPLGGKWNEKTEFFSVLNGFKKIHSFSGSKARSNWPSSSRTQPWNVKLSETLIFYHW